MEPVPRGAYRWPTLEVALAEFGVRVDELAARLNLHVHEWQIDGLGPARGFGGRLSSGRPFELYELQYPIQYGRAKGPALFVDAADLEKQGVQALIAEILQELHASSSELVWVMDHASEQQAARLLQQFRDQSGEKD
jgi:hypothetical protein